MWSYPTVHSDKGRSCGTGDGKESGEILVVFGNDVLLYSDTHCAFQQGTKLKIA